MNNLEDLTTTCPEIGMKHYDRTQVTEEARQQQDLAAKEASFIQAVGYVPTPNIPAQDWEDMVQRNKQHKKRGLGLYVQRGDPARSGSMY